MISTMLMWCAVLGQQPSSSADGRSAVLKDYETAKSKPGASADAHVRLALWCEAHGLGRERAEQLALAIAADPRHALARGLLRLVSYQGAWRPARDVEKEDPADREKAGEYRERRARTPDTAAAQWKLAEWCFQNGLKEQARAHFHNVVRLDPSREAAWRHLGYKKYGNHWLKPEQAAAERREAELQKHANRHWKPRLERIHDGLLSSHAASRAKAENELAAVTDRRAVPMVNVVFTSGGDRSQLAAVSALARIDGVLGLGAGTAPVPSGPRSGPARPR